MISSKDLTNVIVLGLFVLALLFSPLSFGMPGVGLPIVKARPALRADSSEPCEELICNGGFEVIECWTIRDTSRPADYSTAVVRTGSWSMRLGITDHSDAQSYSSIYQEVTIPGDAVSATLSFWYYPICQDALPYDWQEVILYNQSWGFITRPMAKMCSNSQTWTYHTFDLMPYKGQTIILYFNVYNDGGGNLKTAMYLDDVSIQVCRTIATSTPTATTATGTSTPTGTVTPPTATATPTSTPTPSTPEASYTYLPLVRKDPTPTPTPTPISTPTPTPSPTPPFVPGCLPQLGDWTGQESERHYPVSFTVTSDCEVHRFKIKVPFGGFWDVCQITVLADLPIVDDKFTFDWLGGTITGEFHSSTSASGTYYVFFCEDTLLFPASEGTWEAHK